MTDSATDDMKPLAITADDELDEFGLPVRKFKKTPTVARKRPSITNREDTFSKQAAKHQHSTDLDETPKEPAAPIISETTTSVTSATLAATNAEISLPVRQKPSLGSSPSPNTNPSPSPSPSPSPGPDPGSEIWTSSDAATPTTNNTPSQPPPKTPDADPVTSGEPAHISAPSAPAAPDSTDPAPTTVNARTDNAPPATATASHSRSFSTASKRTAHSRTTSAASASAGISEYSHQMQVPVKEESDHNSDDEWQEMPAYASYDMYDDDNRLIAREHDVTADETYGYAGLGGAGKGYTRVDMDDDAESATSMDENTKYLFREVKSTAAAVDDDEQRDAVSQMQATKDLLTEGQRVAYVGVVRVEIYQMVKEMEARLNLCSSRTAKKTVNVAIEHAKMWAQKMMIRLYAHMEINAAEQIMIEQLAEHGVMPADLVPALMANSRVNNPMAEKTPSTPGTPSSRNPRFSTASTVFDGEAPAEVPPPYQTHTGEEMPDVQTPSQMPTTRKIDIDLRWTVLCDLFLLLIADSVYDSRSRALLERVGAHMEVPVLDICRFEKRVTDALEMQQAAEKENWNEDEHLEQRRKMAQTRRYLMMGLATVGGGLVIGLSAGLLAPVIGAGLAAGFTTIGVSGTGSFLAGAGGAAIITSSAAASGSVIGGRAAGRRTGAVKTFEYRPLHNNKRVNLIVTVSGWMTGKVDDVRLPFSTVDSVMGDIYSVLWEPEMLRSMGDTINILATEALTQGLQQVLGSTILISLMAALQLPVVLTKLAYLIDNPWAVSLDRATSAGLILADSLIDRNLGTRPVTLVGYSLGSRVIFSCLQELARKGAYGLVQNVFLYGSPMVVKKDEYLAARSVVSGKFLNGYNRNDWILGYLFRLTSGGISSVAGLTEVVGVPGIDNFDCTEFVSGHMQYRTAMPRLLREAGWLVESDEFNEIEDPDPENHQERQRELISEIEEARRALENESKQEQPKSGFGFWKRKKQLERAEWEVYEDPSKKPGGGPPGSATDPNRNSGVLFDVEAMRAELARDKSEAASHGATTPIPGSAAAIDIRPPPASVSRTDSLRPDMDAAAVSRSLSPGPTNMSFRSASPAPSAYEITPTYLSSSASASASALASASASTAAKKDVYGGAFEPYDEENEIQMTFDTSFQEPSPPPPPPAKDAGYVAGLGVATASAGLSPGFGPSSSVFGSTAGSAQHSPLPSFGDSGAMGAGAGVGAAGVPTISLADPWADYDDDDDDFGKEKEISMTFA